MDKVRGNHITAIIMTLACALALSFTLIGCGNSADNKANFIGTWELESMEDSTMGTVDASTLKAFGLSVNLTLNEDGSGTLVLFGETLDITWEAKSATSMALTIAGEGSTNFTLSDGRLSEESSTSNMTFVRQQES